MRVSSPVSVLSCDALQPNCLDCSTFGEQCNLCEDGYYNDEETLGCGSCNAALLGCGLCETPDECLACAVEGFVLNEDASGCTCYVADEEAEVISISEETGMCQCVEEGKFLTLDGGCQTCQEVIPGCVTCGEVPWYSGFSLDNQRLQGDPNLFTSLSCIEVSNATQFVFISLDPTVEVTSDPGFSYLGLIDYASLPSEVATVEPVSI